jgi:hypothetical protein
VRWIAIVLTGCTLGAQARFAAIYEPDGRAHETISAAPDLGITSFQQLTDVAHQEAVFLLAYAGFGWSTLGQWSGEFGFEVAGIPGAGGGTGFVSSMHIEIDRQCVRWSFGGGPATLLSQLDADDHPDAFGPNPRVTRVYHDLTMFAGWTSCEGSGTSPHAGVAYEVGVAKLLFAPGP